VVIVLPGSFPPWIRQKIPGGESFRQTRRILRESGLNTVCENARCPNIGECYALGTATFLILGNVCTRNCRFCAVKTGVPEEPDGEEPDRIAAAVGRLGLKYAVVTSVTRDDLADGGAEQFALVVKALRSADPGIGVEVLVPDFGGRESAVAKVVESGPDVFAHNLETVPRLYPRVRPGADYRRSLEVLSIAGKKYGARRCKSGLMLGLGETAAEIRSVLEDLRKAGCDIMTFGQYLRPARDKIPVAEFIHPERFRDCEKLARSLGFSGVASGPLVRSSYHAGDVFTGGRDGGGKG
jgi:lipoic acid synthetase